MIDALITSQTRIRLLKKFFLNSNTTAHLRGLESEFGESSNAIRLELNRFEEAGLLISVREGNKKIFQANRLHPLFKDIHNIILKETGIDQVIEKVILRLGKLTAVFLTGDFAHGKDGKSIELLIAGNDIDREYLDRKIKQAEQLVGREVRCQLLSKKEAEAFLKKFEQGDYITLWENNFFPERKI